MVYKKYSATRFSRKRVAPRSGYLHKKKIREGNHITRNEFLAPSNSIPNTTTTNLNKNSDSANAEIDPKYSATLCDDDNEKDLSYQFDSQGDVLNSQYEETTALKTIDATMGFERVLGGFEYGRDRLGWLINMHPTSVSDPVDASIKYSAIDLYFLEKNGHSFKATHIFNPYFYVLCHDRASALETVETYLINTYKPYIASIDREFKEDLSMPNHLVLPNIPLLKISFKSVQDLLLVRKELLQSVKKNDKIDILCRMRRVESMVFQLNTNEDHIAKTLQQDPTLLIKELREYDIPYYMRVCIDLDIRVGNWYKISCKNNALSLIAQTHIIGRPEPVIMAFDIETSKQPLKFPESSIDSIMMISYMIDEMGFLITNREIVSEDIKSFEYTPKPEYEGHFTIYNEPDEKHVLIKFFNHIRLAKPKVFITYNGDFFDWPFIDDRAKFHGLDLKKEIGIYKNLSKEYLSTYACHIDCLYWVKRDSYLPQGSHGLKTVVKAKVGYNPVEIDPEDVTKYAIENPQILSQYSVSDALSTYYLYMKHIHPFIFSLCNIIPMNPDDVLRKGSGTLCESLLMVEAYRADVLIPNKYAGNEEKFFEGHLVESENYIGGHVEAIEAGIFRQDLPVSFTLSQKRLHQLVENIDDTLKFAIVTECNSKVEDVVNYDEVKSSITKILLKLIERPSFAECPLIYHFDVGAMYPNIILTNRLQPYSVVTDQFCNTCDFYNGPDTKCRKSINWMHRCDYYPPDASEYNMILNQLKTESFFDEKGKLVLFEELKNDVKLAKIKERLVMYSRKVYNKIRSSKVVEEKSVVCQRENSFYVNTVRDFRDKRYFYKEQLKKIKESLSNEKGIMEIKELQNLMAIYDSMQLAHKCILNSFYGYVMRKGARWYSIEMAGIVCLVGAKIIQMARTLIDDIGKPLELDTDGIWCILPKSFPGKFTLNFKNSEPTNLFYPCVLLNKMVHENFTNHVYMDLYDKKSYKYITRSENTIFFEVDGPYRAMILPSSSKKDETIKKRYAVFNQDGTLAEIKGFEMKRRGELKLIKLFQSQIFQVFLEGNTIDECYRSVSSAANQWLDIIYSKGACLEDSELFDLISENRNMSRSIDQYGNQKSASISTARRLAELLGDQMVMKHKGLSCKYVICNRPPNAPVSGRAIPCAVFQAKPNVREYYLRKWLGLDSGPVLDVREFLDWKYYLERFANVVQKIIIVPASLQNIQNYVPRIPYPDWLQKKLKAMDMQSKNEKGNLLSAFASIDKDKLPIKQSQTTKNDFDVDRVEIHSESLFENSVIDQYRYISQVFPINKQQDINFINFNPKMYSSYSEWIAQIKKKWLLILKLRETGKLNEIDRVKYARSQTKFTNETFNPRNDALKSSSRSNFDNSLRNKTLPYQDSRKALFNNVWHILQIRHTDVPGVLIMWVIVDNCLHEVKLNLKRVIYINSITDNIALSGLKDGIVVKKEPHYKLLSGSRVYNLYSLQIPEVFYKQNMKLFSAICNHPNIENIYCENISLANYAVIKLGSMAKLKPSLSYPQDFILSVGPQIEDLQPQESSPTCNSKPLTGLFQNIKFDFVYVFYVKLNCGTYTCICNTNTGLMKILIHDNYTAKTALKPSNVKKPREAGEYEEIYQSLFSNCKRAEGVYVKCSNKMNIDVHYSSSEEQLHHYLKMLYESEIQKKTNRYIMLLVQNSHEVSQALPKYIPFINRCPSMSIPLHNDYKKYQFLSWQKNITRYMFTQYFELDKFVQSRNDLSTLFNIPALNIPHDYPIYVTDITFARRMDQAGIIFDWSEKVNNKDRSIGQNYSLYTYEFKYPEVNMLGCYNTLCFELDVQDLILAPLLSSPSKFSDSKFNYGSNSSLLKTSAKSYISSQKSNVLPSDVNVLYHKNSVKSTDVPIIALDIFKSIVMNWTTGVRKKNVYYAIMLSNIYRWFTCKNSAMSTPSLYHKVFVEMGCFFINLIAEIEQLGGRTVYASFNKIIIAMQNSSYDMCISSARQVITGIQNNPMFSPVTFKLSKAWRYLLWLDFQNYGGISTKFVNTAAIETYNNGVNSCEIKDTFFGVKEDMVSTAKTTEANSGLMCEEDSIEMEMSTEKDIIHIDRENFNKARFEVNMFWCIAYSLPSKYRNILLNAIAGYLYNACQINEVRITNYKNEEGSIHLEEDHNNKQKKNNFISIKSYVENVLKTNLIQLISEIIGESDDYHQKKINKGIDDNDLYTKKSSGRDENVRICATMINYICEILNLDHCIKKDIDYLKSELFSFMDISEFSDIGTFFNPFERILIFNHFCLFCSEIRPLNIVINCTSENLIYSNNQDLSSNVYSKASEDIISAEIPICIVNEVPVLNAKSMWSCTACGFEHDATVVEWELIEIVKQDLISWHLQDPVCERCKIAKIEDLRPNCHACSGNVRSHLNKAIYDRRFKAIYNLSHAMRKLFPALKEATTSLAEYMC